MKEAVTRRSDSRHLIFEGVALLLAAPFLLFPEVFLPATVLALLLVALTWALRWRCFPVTPLNGALLFWGASLAVGILVTADPDLTLPKATGLILGLAVWRFACLAITDSHRLRWAGLAFLGLALCFVALGVLGAEWRLKVSWLQRIIDLVPAGLLRLPGAPDAGVQLNQLAGTILLVFPLTLSLALARSWPGAPRTWRPALGFLSVGLLGLLVLSQSRGGWIGGLIGLGVLSWLWWWTLPAGVVKQRLGTGVVVFVLLGLVALAAIGPSRLEQLWQEPPRETAVGNLGTLEFRQEVWRWALVAIGDFPFTGTGLGTFRRVAPRLYPLAVPITYDIAHAHNIFLQVALDVGLPGLVAYLALLFLAMKMGWHVARKDEALRPWALGLLASLIALHAYGMADALAPGSKPALLFWFALGLLCAMRGMGAWEQGSGRVGDDI